MNSESWNSLREALVTVFENSPLAELFELKFIEGHSGDPPPAIYLPLLQDCHIMLLVFGDDIRPGVKDEVRAAVAEGRPIIAMQEKGAILSADDKKFVETVLYPVTTLGYYSSLKDLFAKTRKALQGLVARRLSTRLEAEKLTGLVGAAMKKSPPGTDTMLSFAAFAAQTSQHLKALPMISEAAKEKPRDERIFLAKMALVATARDKIQVQKDDAARLIKLAETDEAAASVLAALKLSGREEAAFADAEIAAWLSKDSPQWQAVRRFADFAGRDALEQSVGEVVDSFAAIRALAQKLEKIKVAGIGVFADAERVMETRLQEIPVSLSDDDLPGVECCLNCMPRDDGEWVILSRERGTLRDLLEEQLYDEHPGPEWGEYQFDGLRQFCGHCGTELDESDSVYEDYHEKFSEHDEMLDR